MTRLNDRYDLMNVLAEGGESVVYLAKDGHTQERVVIKRTKNGISLKDGTDWKRGVTLLKQLDIDSVARVYDAFLHESDLVTYGYVVQQYIEGETLEAEFNRKRYTQTEALETVRCIMGIVKQLQDFSPPILHRDIKPSNILRRMRDGKLVLLDFGLATEQQSSEFGHTLGVGTVGYQAPEQIEGTPKLNTDVYSVGVIALQLLTRRDPKDLLWGYDLKWESAAQFLHEDWRNWLTKALADSDKRFVDAATALTQLEKPGFGDRKSPQPTMPPKPPPVSHHHETIELETMNASRSSPTPSFQHPPSRRRNLTQSNHNELQQTKQLLVASGCSFFFLGIFALPFIYHFYKKKQKLEREMNQG